MSDTILPVNLTRVQVPPIKCQGIKTKLLPFIAGNIRWDGQGRWLEPFLGSGVVALNLAPRRAKLSDTNRHIINLYRAIQVGQVTDGMVREQFAEMGSLLQMQGESYFYEVRDRFNASADPLDFLFLNRACFNGVMRFNARGRYNVPFGKKPDRFRKGYITKIVNQICGLRRVLQENAWQLACLDWKESLADAQPDDFVYLDPPYIGRHTDYFNQWDMQDAVELARVCHTLPCGYSLSMWQRNRYRANEHLAESWKDDEVRTFSHFYHVGPTESLRNEMMEALAIRRGFAAPEDSCRAARAGQPGGAHVPEGGRA